MIEQFQAYEIARNALIPDAEAYADKITGIAPNSSEKAYKDWEKLWNLTFHSKMNQLWKEVKFD